MAPERKYDPAEFEISTWRRSCEVQVTFDVQESDLDFLEVAVQTGRFAYRSVDDVFRHCVARHVKFLGDIGMGRAGFYLTDQFRAFSEANRELQERDFCIVIDIFYELILHFLCGEARLAHLLARTLRCKVRRICSKHWREIYLREIDEIMRLVSGYCRPPILPIASLNPSTFEDGSDAEE